jgi:AraC family transcriptional regulator
MLHSPNINKCIPASAEPGLLPSLAKLLDSARKELDGNRDTAKALMTRAVSLLRVEIERQSADIAHDQTGGGLVPWQVRRLNVYIEARLELPILLQELSAVSKLSTAYFSRAFKRTFRETPHSYIVRRRLERAESLMLTSDLSLSDIALRCGFTDQAHLCKLFRKRYEKTPAAWRRERTEIDSRKSKANLPEECAIECY